MDKLGEGGMGVVYRACQLDLKREVALKFLIWSCAPREFQRFKREAKILAQLKHSAVPEIYHFGVWERAPYFAMELVLGNTLEQEVARVGKLEVDHAIAIAKQLCAALETTHKSGIIHRDLKPANIILYDGRIKILDFGLSKLTDSQSLTSTGTLIGSPQFMSPEQCLGEKADCRADVYSLGCVFYYMLIGKPPFNATTPTATLRQQVQDNWEISAEDKARMPTGLVSVLELLTNKDPAQRFQSMGELQVALQLVTDGKGQECVTRKKRVSLRRTIFTVFLAGLALAIVLTGLMLAIVRRADSTSTMFLNRCISRARGCQKQGLYSKGIQCLLSADHLVANSSSAEQVNYYLLLDELEVRQEHYALALSYARQADAVASRAVLSAGLRRKICISIAQLSFLVSNSETELKSARRKLVETRNANSKDANTNDRGLQIKLINTTLVALDAALANSDLLKKDVNQLRAELASLKPECTATTVNALLDYGAQILLEGKSEVAIRIWLVCQELQNTLPPEFAGSNYLNTQDYLLSAIANSKATAQKYNLVKHYIDTTPGALDFILKVAENLQRTGRAEQSKNLSRDLIPRILATDRNHRLKILSTYFHCEVDLGELISAKQTLEQIRELAPLNESAVYEKELAAASCRRKIREGVQKVDGINRQRASK